MSLDQAHWRCTPAVEGSERVVAMNVAAVERAPDRAGGVAEVGRDLEFETLFERYARPVSYFFAHRGFSPEECRDLTQETFVGVYRGMDAFRRDASVETWLFTIAANVWRNEVRSRTAGKREGREVPLEGLAEGSGTLLPAELREADDPLAGLLEEERACLLREALGELPAQMRRCLLLRLDQQLKYREIAQVLRVSIETVKSQLFQARERLRHRLA